MIKGFLENLADGTEVDQKTMKKVVQRCLRDDPYLRKQVRNASSTDEVVKVTASIEVKCDILFARAALQEMEDDQKP
jgi:predicted regulator of amino acid metabolism with ACT domain